MITCEQSIENFCNRMNELISSKYIVADGKVSEVLKTISESELLFELFEHLTKQFDYKTFKSVCFVKKGGKGCFNLPKNDGDIIAFCFLILMEIDAKKIDLLRLLTEYFYSSEGKQASFNLFAESFLVPFKKVTEKVAYKLIIGENEEKSSLYNADKNGKEKGVKKQNTASEQSKIEKTVLEYINTVNNFISRAKKAKEKDYLEELYYVLNEFLKFIKNGDLEGITLSFTALKYMAEVIKKVKIDVGLLVEQLAEVI